MNLAAILLDSAREHSDRMAVRLADGGLTYGQLDEASARVAGMLAERGIEPGDRVAVMLPNVPEFAVVYYGTLRAGAIVVPMNPLLKTREVAYYLRDAGAKAIFAWHTAFGEAQSGAEVADAEAIVVDPEAFPAVLAAADPVTPMVDRDDDDTAIILYTSGTTGHPKGAELTHTNLLQNAEIVVSDLAQLTADDVIFGGLPLFHSFGQTCALNAAIATGASVSLLPRFDPQEALRLLARDGVTVLAGVPTMYVALLAHFGNDSKGFPALRVCISGGAGMPVEVMKAFEEAFACMVLEGYGLSETSPVACFNHPGGARKSGSIGTPIRGVEMRVIDSDGDAAPQGDAGEIAIRGHNVMKGYWRRPEATLEAIPDGWFRTGDIGRMDEDGHFYIVDRQKDLIIRGGYNVYPREIEEVLYEHPAVAEAAVIGVPHPELGEEIAAAVALKPGAAATPRELRDHVKVQVAAYKYPRYVWLVDELPKGSTGKILKREIVPPADLVV